MQIINKKILSVIVLAVVIVAVGFYFAQKFFVNVFLPDESPRVSVSIPEETAENAPDIEIVAENLTIPWDIVFLPATFDESGRANGTALVSERMGRLLRIDFSSDIKGIIDVTGIRHIGEGGLLGLAIHPEFEKNRWLYLYMTAESEEGLTNRVTRYVFSDNVISEPVVIVSGIPGARFHDGGRIDFGPDGYLYITTGDAGNSRLAQDINSLAGKILRVNDDGSIPTDNPFGNMVWSYGHRNPQGLAWDAESRLWLTEHGPSGVWPNCCQDEINLIKKGENYGWPESVGDIVLSGVKAPVLHSGRDIWAPASALYYDGSIFFGGLRGEALYEAVLDGEKIIGFHEHFKGMFGRIRAIRLGPNGMFYITTSNRDGRGAPDARDDKIIRLNPSQFR